MDKEAFDLEEIKANQIQPLLNDEDWIILDVRHQFERSSGFLPGLHIPLEELKSQAKTLDQDKNILIYCRCGSRSETAVEELRAQGFQKRLVNLEGGIMAVRRFEAKENLELIRLPK